MLLLITDDAISHNDNPMAEHWGEGTRDPNRVPVVCPALSATGREIILVNLSHVTAVFG